MFDYAKVMKKLGKFTELEKKKQKKLLSSIYFDEEFREWFYNVNRNNGDGGELNGEDAAALFSALASPMVIRRTTKLVQDTPYSEFDHTASCLMYMTIEQALELANESIRSVRESDADNKTKKQYGEKFEVYQENVGKLFDALRNRAKEDVKGIANRSNFPKDFIHIAYQQVPDRKYIPKYKVSLYVNNLLQEFYKYVSRNGLENEPTLKWGTFFGTFFGNEMTASAAITVLMEGVSRINAYRDSSYFDDIREAWDHLTQWALSELDRSPEHVRSQMLEIYMKRVGRMGKHGKIPQLRVNLLSDSIMQFRNLYQTINHYSEKLARVLNGGNPVPTKGNFIDNSFKKVMDIAPEKSNPPITELPSSIKENLKEILNDDEEEETKSIFEDASDDDDDD